ncbi:MAG: 3-hydroxyacyl-CoA dehydrogenase family protein [bacterium]|nr:3-hydroxyacyl-CoA dehydrogenase family protein [bacterium]
MANQPFETATVIGTGMMGPGIAMTLALGGLRVTLLSRSEQTAEQGVDKARGQLRLLEQHGLAANPPVVAAIEQLSGSADFDSAIASADIVVESAPENMEFKQELFARIDAVAKPGAALCSNTSGLSITAIASKCVHPERVLTTHFWNPPHLMPLVEVVKGDRTSADVAEAVHALLARCGKTPVLVHKDTPGQLGNRLQMALVREAVHIVQEGIAGAEEVDLAAKAGFGLRLPVYGILEHQDMVGLDLGARITDYVSRDLNNQPGMPRLMREMLDSGALGVKTGKGFYDWSKRDAKAVKARRDQFVIDFLKASY